MLWLKKGSANFHSSNFIMKPIFSHASKLFIMAQMSTVLQLSYFSNANVTLLGK